jgi:hypothetical protein
MPRIFGLNIIATLVAGIAFWLLGYVWYAVLFGEAWTALVGFTPEQLANTDNQGMLMTFGALLAIVSAGFLGFMLNRLDNPSMLDAIKHGVLICLGFVVMTQVYRPIYELAPVQLLCIDASYQLIGFVLMTVIHRMLGSVMVKD